MALYSTPISNGFGLISLLAGVSKDTVDVLRGAAFSGNLTEPVRIRILNGNRADGEWNKANIEYEVDSQGKHGRVERGKTYG